jgi:hypothetical protein
MVSALDTGMAIRLVGTGKVSKPRTSGSGRCLQINTVEMVAAMQTIKTHATNANNPGPPFQLVLNAPNPRIKATETQIPIVATVLAVVSGISITRQLLRLPSVSV